MGRFREIKTCSSRTHRAFGSVFRALQRERLHKSFIRKCGIGVSVFPTEQAHSLSNNKKKLKDLKVSDYIYLSTTCSRLAGQHEQIYVLVDCEFFFDVLFVKQNSCVNVSLVLLSSFFHAHIILAILRLLAAPRHRPLVFLPRHDRSTLASLRLLSHNLNWSSD